MFFFNTYTLPTAVIGYLIGAIVLRILIRLRGQEFYLRRVMALIKLIAVFIRELFFANLRLMVIIASPKITLSSGIIAVPTKLESDTEKALFGVMMTLIPGTMPIEFSDDDRYIYVHALDATHKEAVIKSVQMNYEKVILEVTRSHDV